MSLAGTYLAGGPGGGGGGGVELYTLQSVNSRLPALFRGQCKGHILHQWLSMKSTSSLTVSLVAVPGMSCIVSLMPLQATLRIIVIADSIFLSQVGRVRSVPSTLAASSS